MSHLPNVYAIIGVTQVALIDFDQIGETDEDTIRKNIALTEFVIKWYSADIPTFISDGSVTIIGSEMTLSEAQTLMNTPEWTDPLPPPP